MAMKTKYNEMFIGISVTVAILIVISAIMWLQRSSIFEKGLSLKVLVQDAQGVSVGDEVRYKGLAIGSVKGAKITPEGVLIHVKIKKGIPVPVDSKFSVRVVNLLGETAVIIEPGQAKELLHAGQTVPGSSESGLEGLTERGGKLLDRLERLLAGISEFADSQLNRDLHETVREFRAMTAEWHRFSREQRSSLSRSIANIMEITEKSKAPVDSLSAALSGQGETLRRLAASARKLDALLSRMDAGKGTMGRLIAEDSLYVNANRTLADLDSLLRMIRRNPKRFFQVKIF